MSDIFHILTTDANMLDGFYTNSQFGLDNNTPAGSIRSVSELIQNIRNAALEIKELREVVHGCVTMGYLVETTDSSSSHRELCQKANDLLNRIEP